MSIQSYIEELKNIKAELKFLRTKIKNLKDLEKKAEIKISEFLKSKGQPGLKYQGSAIILEEKEKSVPKKVKERDHDMIEVLKNYGVSEPEKALKDITNAKSQKVLKESLKITNYKT